MRAKEYLEEIRHLESVIAIKKQRADLYRQMAEQIGNAAPSGMPKPPRSQASPMAEAVCKAVDLEREVQKDEALLQKKRLFLLEAIGSLSSADVQSVLIKRYLERKSWEDVAAEVCYSRRRVFQLHREGLEALDAMLECP